MPHLVGAQRANKDIRIRWFNHHTHTHTHGHAHTHTDALSLALSHTLCLCLSVRLCPSLTHTSYTTHTTNTCVTGDGSVRLGRKRQISMQKRWFFSFDLKEESEDECLTDREDSSDHRSDVLKGALPRGPAHPRNSGDPSIRDWVRRRVEMK